MYIELESEICIWSERVRRVYIIESEISIQSEKVRYVHRVRE